MQFSTPSLNKGTKFISPATCFDDILFKKRLNYYKVDFLLHTRELEQSVNIEMDPIYKQVIQGNIKGSNLG